MKIVWRTMEGMAQLSGLPMPTYYLVRDNIYTIKGDYCVADLNHLTNVLSLNIINRGMPHPQCELCATYFHEALHIVNWNILRRKAIDNLIDWVECHILQKTVYRLWR